MLKVFVFLFNLWIAVAVLKFSWNLVGALWRKSLQNAESKTEYIAELVWESLIWPYTAFVAAAFIVHQIRNR